MGKVHLRNAQWAVTDYGLESVNRQSDYYIAKERLLETTHRDREYYDWPIHMAEKSWVDVGAFNEAYEVALRIHVPNYEASVDEFMLAATVVKAHQIARIARLDA